MQSRGACEICHKPADCHDVPSRALPIPRYLLSKFRYDPGAKLKMVLTGKRIMVLELCSGMIRDGGMSSGGAEMVAIVDLQTGKTGFIMDDSEVERDFG